MTKFLMLLAVIVIVGTGAYFATRTSTTIDTRSDASQDVANLVALVGKLIELPTDEEPVIATVSDPQQLKNQAFFAKAQKGDKVLIYNKSRKAILYNPTTNRIIDVAPLNEKAPAQ